MIPPRAAAKALLLMLSIVAIPAGRAVAQGLNFSILYRALRPISQEFVPHASALADCASGPYGLELCLPTSSDIRWPSALGVLLSAERGQEKAPLTRFAHLAGMFMGRVDAAQWGGLRINIKLTLK
ncbi:MAG: hypothetical protein HY921_07270 [Elusimicrobia bacterium]|nr:hypothetical protein [Elusimicrobiota bacterium]